MSKKFSVFNLEFLIPRGFTLVEIMVVMGIMAILASFIIANLLTSQKRSFDARRKADMKELQNAFEQYYVVEGDYPSSEAEITADASYFVSRKLPEDPRNTGSFVYTVSYGGGSSYCACALMEESEGNASDAACTYGPGSYFCVSQLQE